MRACLLRSVVVLGLWLLGGAPAFGGPADHVLVVANTRHEWSVRLANAYRASRGIPDARLLVLDVPVDATISRAAYQRSIEEPVARWLRDRAAMDDTLFIVLGPG